MTEQNEDLITDRMIEQFVRTVIDGKCREVKSLNERISILNFQAGNYPYMRDAHKQLVLKDLIIDLEKAGWDKDTIKRLKAEQTLRSK